MTVSITVISIVTIKKSTFLGELGIQLFFSVKGFGYSKIMSLYIIKTCT